MPAEKKAVLPSHDGSQGTGELERVLAELREANERLVITGVRMQELAEQAEMRRLQAEAATAAAEAASQAKDEFLAALSHELRTPLNAILGWTYMLRRGTLNVSAAERALEVIERNAKSQSHVVADLLQVSEIITGKLQLDVHDIDLAPLIASSLDALRPAARAKKISLECDIRSVDPILGDSGRLQQILWNLLSNAIKFTPSEGRIQIGLMQAGSIAQISITDSGVGIAPEFLPYVFDRFRQEQSSYGRSFGGLGLGLAIARQLTELHGGTLKAESAGKQQGSIFTAAFPVLGGVRASALGDPKMTEAHTLKGLRLLVVEDEPDSRDFLTALLQGHGAHVSAASSSRGALALLKARRPDMIVADVGLPDEDGYAFIKKVRAGEGEDSGLEKVPALALTAYARREDRERALASGYQMHIGKPFEPEQFLAAVVSLVRHARTARSSDAASSQVVRAPRQAHARPNRSDAPPKRYRRGQHQRPRKKTVPRK